MQWLIFTPLMLIAATAAYAGWRAAPWLPSRKKDKARILELIDLKEGDKIAELGAGDGSVLLTIAAQIKKDGLAEAKATGLEVSLLPYIIGKIRTHFAKLPAKFIFADFFHKPLNDFSVIYCFLTPAAMSKLAPKFKKELPKGSRIISYAFKIEGWTPEAISKPKETDLPIYRYRVDF